MTLAVSLGVGLIALLAALFLWTLGDRFFPPLVLALTLTGGAGIIANTPLGDWIRWCTGWVNDNTSSFGHLSSITVTGLTALAGVGWIVWKTVAWFKAAAVTAVENRGRPDGGDAIGGFEAIIAFPLPGVIAFIPGVIGEWTTYLLAAPVTGLSWLISHGFGFH